METKKKRRKRRGERVAGNAFMDTVRPAFIRWLALEKWREVEDLPGPARPQGGQDQGACEAVRRGEEGGQDEGEEVSFCRLYSFSNPVGRGCGLRAITRLIAMAIPPMPASSSISTRPQLWPLTSQLRA